MKDKPKRRKKRHVIEIPDQATHPWRYRWVKLRWRAAVMTVQYPVQLALVVAILVSSIPVWMLVRQSSTIKSQQTQITELVTQIQLSRAAAVGETCGKINRTTIAVNAEIGYLKGLILNGAKSTKAFDRTLRQLGLPPYRKRLAQAEKQAAGLNRFVLTPLNCEGLKATVKKQTPPPPKRPSG
jgi:hypothetical protein